METAFDITAGSEDDASVKVHDKNTLTQYRFQLFKYYISFFFIVLIFLCSICVPELLSVTRRRLCLDGQV